MEVDESCQELRCLQLSVKRTGWIALLAPKCDVMMKNQI